MVPNFLKDYPKSSNPCLIGNCDPYVSPRQSIFSQESGHSHAIGYITSYKEKRRHTSESSISNRLNRAIEESRYILNLEDGWDHGHAIEISLEVYDMAITFLKTYSERIQKDYGISIDMPEINPCIDGSIDLSWRTRKARMLINFTLKEDKGIASFYGDLYQNINARKGQIEPNIYAEDLAVWMKNLIL